MNNIIGGTSKKIHLLVSFRDSGVVGERVDGSHAWLVDSDNGVQEFISLNRVF